MTARPPKHNIGNEMIEIENISAMIYNSCTHSIAKVLYTAL